MAWNPFEWNIDRCVWFLGMECNTTLCFMMVDMMVDILLWLQWFKLLQKGYVRLRDMQKSEKGKQNAIASDKYQQCTSMYHPRHLPYFTIPYN